MSAERVFVETAAGRPKSERPITALFADLVNETSLLFRQEIELFKAETAAAVSRAGRGAAAIAVGGVFALGGFLALLATAALALAIVLPPWLAALIVAIIALAIAAVLLLIGKSQLGAEALMPRRTLNSLREDKAWLKEQV
ncbi:MAG TPA: phage holin family protein [Stellaceae bacterium]|nr:phage holin family protein [Stellaceae bacterium]